MYHIRFLKSPASQITDSRYGASKKQRPADSGSQSHSIARQAIPHDHTLRLQTVATVTNDLGEEFFYGDVNLLVSVHLISGKQTAVNEIASRTAAVDLEGVPSLMSETLRWTHGMRSIPISVSMPMTQLKQYMQRHRIVAEDIFVVLSLQTTGETPEDSMHMSLEDSVQEVYEQCGDVLTREPDQTLRLEKFQVLGIRSLPIPVLSDAKYQVNGTPRSTERYYIRPIGTDTEILEEMGNGIERHLWNAGIQTSMYCKTLLPDNFSVEDNDDILELGTGVGIVSIALAQYFKKGRYLATDLPEAQELCDANLALNGVGESVKFASLDWESGDATGKKWHLIAVTDCTYNPTYYDALIHVLRKEATADTGILIAHKVREAVGEMEFFVKFHKWFAPVKTTWTHHSHESVYIGYYTKL